MLTETITALFDERDQATAAIAALDADTKRTSGYYAREAITLARRFEADKTKAIDGTLPVLLAAAGRVEEVRALYPESSLLVGEFSDVVAASQSCRFETALKALGPFPDVYFGDGRNGQTFLAIKQFGENWMVAAQQTRYPDVAIYVGPEKQIKHVACRYRLHALQFPDGRSLASGRREDFLLRIEGPTDSPLYNPRDLANHIPSYVAMVGRVTDGFISLRDEMNVRAVATPQVFTAEWWRNSQMPPDDLDWRSSLLNISDWDPYRA